MPLRAHPNTPKNGRFAAAGSIYPTFSSGSVNIRFSALQSRLAAYYTGGGAGVQQPGGRAVFKPNNQYNPYVVPRLILIDVTHVALTLPLDGTFETYVDHTHNK